MPTIQPAATSGPIEQQLQRELAVDFRLARLNHEMAAFLGCDPAELPNARKNLTDAQSGKLPAFQDPQSQHWRVRHADKPKIAAIWGLKPRSTTTSGEPAHRVLAEAS